MEQRRGIQCRHGGGTVINVIRKEFTEMFFEERSEGDKKRSCEDI